MLAFNVTHVDDRRLCETECSDKAVAVWGYPDCAGLCQPIEQLRELHGNERCHVPAVDASTGQLGTLPRMFWFKPVPRIR